MRCAAETMIRSFGYATLFVLLLLSCRKGDKVPAYLEVPSVSVVTQTGQGSGSHRIVALWMFLNDQPVGVWEPPMRVPMLASGPSNIKMIAGVRRNGIADDRIQYPYYATWESQVDLLREGVRTIVPEFRYFEEPRFWVEDFEGVGFQFTIPAQSDTTLQVITDPDLVFEGNGSAAFFLTPERPFFRCITEQNFNSSGVPVFLELDYRSDHRFLVGVSFFAGGNQVLEPKLVLNPTLRDDGGMPWNKVYVDLSELMTIPGVTNREIYFESQLASGASSGQVYIDNVKLIRP